jgi:hypothetical protein
MEWFIKQNSTLPILQVEISKNGRSDFNLNQNLNGINKIYISLYEPETQTYRVTSKECFITNEQSPTNPTDIIYYANYQFTNRETSKIGRFEVELSLIDIYNDLVLPLSEKLYVNIVDSFSIKNNSFKNLYELIAPCCNNETGLPNPIEPFADALLFIEPLSSLQVVSEFMSGKNSKFYGFSNGMPPQSNADIINYMEMFALFGGNFLPSVIRQSIPQESGGVDDFGLPIVQYNFKTTRVSLNTINGPAWYTWVLPKDSINDGKQTKISYLSTTATTISENELLVQNMNNTIYNYESVYTGLNFTPNRYSLYTTFHAHNFSLNNNVKYIYFKGNTVE